MELSMRTVEDGTEDEEYVADLYVFSFPEPERERFDRIMKVSKTDLGDLYVILDGDVRIGMLYTMRRKDLVYIYYLAVDPGERGKGYGSAVLAELFGMYPEHRFALNCEAPDPKSNNNEQRLERMAFYERNGFQDTGRRTRWEGVEYALMSHGGRIGQFEVNRLFSRAARYGRRGELAYGFRREHVIRLVTYQRLYCQHRYERCPDGRTGEFEWQALSEWATWAYLSRTAKRWPGSSRRSSI